jgi:hypothetical protein
VNLKEMRGVVSALLGTRGLVVISLVAGFLIGWLIMGWVIWPLQWESAAPADLQQGYRRIYLTTVARLYEVDPSIDVQQILGIQSWNRNQLEQDLNQAYLEAAPETQQSLARLGRQLDVVVDGQVAVQQGGRSPWGIVAVAVVVLFAAGGVLGLWYLRQQGGLQSATAARERVRTPEARVSYAEDEAPLAQFVTSYSIGEDYYDQSFSIETPTGEFLGECGVGISEAIGVGDPKKVTAFEVWLFDKNDIRTVTKVLMSEHAFYDEALRAKLAPKGEAVLASDEGVIELETASLRVAARVVELAYGEGELPDNSFITRLTIELAAWQLEPVEEQQEPLTDVNWEA